MKGNSFEVFYTSKFEVIFIIVLEDAGDNQEICKNNKIVGDFSFYQPSFGGILLWNSAIAANRSKVSMSQYLNTKSSWFDCALRDDEAVCWVSTQ